jgi:hypothetical protein
MQRCSYKTILNMGQDIEYIVAKSVLLNECNIILSTLNLMRFDALALCI